MLAALSILTSFGEADGTDLRRLTTADGCDAEATVS
jgi:hypothetical protein